MNSSVLNASILGNSDNMENLLMKGNSPNKSSNDYQGLTPLIHSIQIRDHDKIRVLLKYGANVNKADYRGNTPLTYAAYFDDVRAVEMLAGVKGINPDRTNKNGHTSLMETVISMGNNKYTIVKKILEIKGVNINKKNRFSGDTALHMSYHDPELIKILVKHGADINMTNKDGYTTLHRAVINGKKESAITLLDLGANPFVVINPKDRITAFHKMDQSLALKYTDRLIQRFYFNKSLNFNKNIRTKFYNYTTLEYSNLNKSKVLGFVVSIKTGKPLRWVDYDTFKKAQRGDSSRFVSGMLHEGEIMVLVKASQVKSAYNKLKRLSSIAKGARTRKNLSIIKSSKSSKEKAKSRIERNEMKTGKIANALRTLRNYGYSP